MLSMPHKQGELGRVISYVRFEQAVDGIVFSLVRCRLEAKIN